MNKTKAILYAFLAAVFYAINVPISKILLKQTGPTTMAALLYLGAGVGIGILSLVNKTDSVKSEKLTKKDMPFVIGMIVLDIAAPLFLMLGISYGSSANASLAALIVMIAGSVLVVADTLIRSHEHEHRHIFTHTHNGTTHTHTVTHTHEHTHYATDHKHKHRHTQKELEKLSGARHA